MSTNIFSILQNAGVTGTALQSAVSAIAAASPTHTIQSYLTQILANSSDLAVCKDLAVKIKETPNCPASVAQAAGGIESATTPQEVLAGVQAVNTALNLSGGFNLNNIL